MPIHNCSGGPALMGWDDQQRCAWFVHHRAWQRHGGDLGTHLQGARHHQLSLWEGASVPKIPWGARIEKVLNNHSGSEVSTIDLRYASGEERCIACKLCEAVCPAQVPDLLTTSGLTSFSWSWPSWSSCFDPSSPWPWIISKFPS